mmetsp:Transcript_14853/g.24195  ORF Transcript_14853/g.24195 Transcript_14853/m.24195 type:complete len:409 (+) Transcript_14853:652-1878(+)
MWIDLGDDEVVDVEQLGELLGGQVHLHAAVHEGEARGGLRPQRAVRTLHQQRGRVEHPGHGGGAHGGAPDEHVRGGEVVQQPGRVRLVDGRDRDVDDAPGAVESLLEGVVPDVVPEHGAEVLGVHAQHVLVVHQHGQQARGEGPQRGRHQQAPEGRGPLLLHRPVPGDLALEEGGDDVPLEHGAHLGVRAGAHHGCHDRAGRGARDHARQQPLGKQALDHAEVVKAQAGPAAEHEGRAAEGVPRLVEEGQLRVRADQLLLGVGRGNQAQRPTDGGQVPLHQHLRARARERVEPAAQHAVLRPADAPAQREHEREDVPALHQVRELVDAVLQRGTVVEGAVRVPPPLLVALQLVGQLGVLLPLPVGRRRAHLLMNIFDQPPVFSHARGDVVCSLLHCPPSYQPSLYSKN